MGLAIILAQDGGLYRFTAMEEEMIQFCMHFDGRGKKICRQMASTM